ncbi:MAG: putative porin [Prevotella sp.]|jgi:hypothetical protein
MKKYILGFLLTVASLPLFSQVGMDDGYNQIDENGNITTQDQRQQNDSLGTDKEIPVGMYVWTVDSRFGDRQSAEPDTLSPMYMNTIFTTGLRGEYNTTGNLGAPRQARIFIDRKEQRQFIFTNPYDYFVSPVEDFHFTNTLSPFTNLSYNKCGDRTNGEDHFTAKFGVNAGKKIGVGFKFDYIYARGYYSNQAASHFNYSLYGSYLGDRYQAHFLAITNHQKVTENGGITQDLYITHPESFNEDFQTSEIPTMLSQNWNRNDNQHVFFTHRYNVGYNRKVPMTEAEIEAKKFALASKKEAEEREAKEKALKEAGKTEEDIEEDDIVPKASFSGRPDDAKIVDRTQAAANPQTPDSLSEGGRIAVSSKAAADSLIAASEKAAEDTAWLKNEYVPVTSFIHTLDFNNYRRIYQAYDTPEDFYLDYYTVNEKFVGDSLYDKTNHWTLRNTFAISMLEGFNKWAKAGLKVFASHEMRHFTLPDAEAERSWNENAVSVGGQLSKTQGKTLHYNVVGEFGVAGINATEIHVDGNIDLNFPLFKDTMTLAASGFFHHEKPGFYYRHYQSRHFWWDDDDLSFIDHIRVQGLLNYQKTRTRLRVAHDIIKNHTYYALAYKTTDVGRFYNALSVKQNSGAISLLTAQLSQDFTFGPLNWESVITFQKSSKEEVLPVPLLNIYSNLFLRFKIANVLKCDFGGDVRYFTKYKAPEYAPAIGQYVVQANDEKVETGNYPIVNVYANFHLKHTRFFVMMSHVNAGSGKKDYFLTPHHPLNGRTFRLGLSWNFYN